MMAERMRIGDLAKKANVTTRTIRYYEELGLLKKGQEERTEGDFRYYDETDFARLQKIQILKQVGLSLEDISSVLDLYFDQATVLEGKQKTLALLQRHLRETDEKILTLQQFRTELQENIAGLQRMIARSQKE